MSGPKVVRVVTREEILAICSELLRNLRSAAASWDEGLKRAGAFDDDASAAFKARIAEVEALLRADRFMDVQKQVPDEIAFIKSDLRRRRAKAVEARTVALQQARQLKANASVLFRELLAKSREVDAGTATRLRAIASGSLAGGVAEAALAEAFRLLAPPAAPAALTTAQRELATRLSSSEKVPSFEAWRTAHSPAVDTRTIGLLKQLAELSVLSEARSKEFSDRLNAIDQDGETADTNLRLDSLVIDLATSVSEAKRYEALAAEAQQVFSEVDETNQADGAIQPLTASVAQALAQRDVLHLPALIANLRSELALAATRRAAEARRAAVLEGLRTLGYEVREGMDTAWAQNGRVVLKKPDQIEYGLEIASAPGAERMQVRAVAFSASRDLSRDFGVEKQWCGDFSKLQDLVANQGGAIHIEKALAVGAVPLKAVEFANIAATNDAAPLSRAR